MNFFRKHCLYLPASLGLTGLVVLALQWSQHPVRREWNSGFLVPILFLILAGLTSPSQPGGPGEGG